MTPTARHAIARWTAQTATDGANGETLLEGFAERALAAGFPLWRGFATLASLHPTLEARSFAWVRGEGTAKVTEHLRQPSEFDDRNEWLQSPLYALYLGDQRSVRHRLDHSSPSLNYPMLRDMQARGATDYLAYKTWFPDEGAGEGIMTSWTTDRADGFTDEHVAWLEDLLPSLEIALKSHSLSWTTRQLLETYLGRDAAQRVLAGEIQRGVAQSLDAILWSSDLEGFTKLSDQEPRERMIDLLNAYAEVTARAIEAEGGQVLKFIGDGMLAAFDLAAGADAADRALAAAVAAVDATANLSQARAADGLPVSRLRVALHRGDVFYGNVGSPNRLDFTVIGPAVNEAARLCDICRSLEQDIIVSAAFHAAAGTVCDRLVGLGRYALRGVGAAQHLYTVERPHR
ncbi:MAG: adenylate/guanylate cyclase domain-containing protein [Pseudomonadota bacterium]